MFSKSKVDSKSRHWKPLFCPVYELAITLSADQPFDRQKDKITPGMYLGMYKIYARKVSLVLRLLTGRVLTQFHVTFVTYFTTINFVTEILFRQATVRPCVSL